MCGALAHSRWQEPVSGPRSLREGLRFLQPCACRAPRAHAQRRRETSSCVLHYLLVHQDSVCSNNALTEATCVGLRPGCWSALAARAACQAPCVASKPWTWHAGPLIVASCLLSGAWGWSTAQHSEAWGRILGCMRAGYCGFVPAAVGAPQGQQQPGEREARQADMLLLTLDQYSRG